MKIFKYSVVGATATVVDVGIFFVFAKLLDYNYLIVGASGFVLATLVNYYFSIKYVFESGQRFGRKTEFALVYLASGLGLVFHLLALYALVEWMAIEKFTSKLLASGAVFLWNYGSRNFFIFSPGKE